MKLGIIIGSTRENRKTPSLAKWVTRAAKDQLEAADIELVDLKDFAMPFFDEPVSPRYNPNREIDVRAQRWLKKLEEFDAYVFVTPEYNHSIPAVLKNALDYVTWEIKRKPAAVLSHGSAGGARAMTDLKEILSESKALPVPIPPLLAVTNLAGQIDDHGRLTEAGKANEYLQANLTELLEDLEWHSEALSAARERELAAA